MRYLCKKGGKALGGHNLRSISGHWTIP